MSVYLEPNETAFRYFDLVIKNVGRSSARNVTFRVASNQKHPKSKILENLDELGILRFGLPFIAPGQEFRFAIGSYQELESSQLAVAVRYFRDSRNKDSNAIRASFPLDVRPYEGMRRIGERPEQTTAKALKEISATLNRIKTTDAIRVRTEREFLFSATLDHWRIRWFGDYVTNRDGGPIKYFVNQLRIVASRRCPRWRP
jgi:hypothetical protein